MNTFVEFPADRKAIIVHIKGLLTNPEKLRRERDENHHRIKKLFLRDYVVYAAIRGADFRKACHEEGHKAARDHMQVVLRWIDENERAPSAYYQRELSRFVPEGVAYDELKACLELAISK